MKKIVFAGFEENLLITKGRELFVLFGYQFLVTLLSFSCVLWMCITYKPVLIKVKEFLFLFPIPDKVGTESSNYWHKTGVLLLRVRFSMTVCVKFNATQNIMTLFANWCFTNSQNMMLRTGILWRYSLIDILHEQEYYDVIR